MSETNEQRFLAQEEEYFATKKKLEQQYMQLGEEKRQFRRFLDQLSNNVHYPADYYAVKPDKSALYQLLASASEEADLRIRKKQRSLESQLEENQQTYAKNYRLYQENKQKEARKD